jgi:hypothetical protein
MTEDPAIRALFGPAPSDVDLTASEAQGELTSAMMIAQSSAIKAFRSAIRAVKRSITAVL